MAYRDALLDELRPKVPGIQAPVDPTTPMNFGPVAPPSQPAPTNTFRDRLGGFDTGKLDDTSHSTPKYVFARHAQNFDDRDPTGRASLIEALRGDPSGFFTNARLEGDILKGSYDPDTGGYGDVDIIKGLKAGGEGWQWGAIDGSSGGMAPAVSGAGMALPLPTIGMTQPTQGLTQAEMGLPQEPDASPYLAALLAQLGVQ